MDVPLEKLPPLGALGIRALERVRRVAVLRVAHEQPLVGSPRTGVVHQLFVEHPGQLGEQAAFAPGALGDHELDLEQPLYGLVLAPPLVGMSRRFEELRELFLAHARIALDLLTQLLPRRDAIRVVLQQP